MKRRCVVPTILVSGLLAATVACGSGRAGSDPTASTPAMCEATRTVRKYMLDGRSFASIVQLSHQDQTFRGVAAALALSPARPAAEDGPYGPVLRYFAAIGKDQAGQSTPIPELDDPVLASARRLDRDLAAGVCD